MASRVRARCAIVLHRFFSAVAHFYDAASAPDRARHVALVAGPMETSQYYPAI
jgi:hypothetical protein